MFLEPNVRPVQTRRVAVNGVEVDVLEMGIGQPLLFLHGEEGPTAYSIRYLNMLAERYHVIAPWHPGFGGSDLPEHFREIGDLAYFYLDFLEHEDLSDVVVVGAGFGGWVAAETAIRNNSRIGCLVLFDPLGIRVSADPTAVDITDLDALNPADRASVLFHDPAVAERDLTVLDESTREGVARSIEAWARFGWKPYLHNRGLRHWLHRVQRPALVIRGASDGVVPKTYHEAYAAALGAGEVVEIANAGHSPHLEQPEATVHELSAFVENAYSATTA